MISKDLFKQLSSTTDSSGGSYTGGAKHGLPIPDLHISQLKVHFSSHHQNSTSLSSGTGAPEQNNIPELFHYFGFYWVFLYGDLTIPPKKTRLKSKESIFNVSLVANQVISSTNKMKASAGQSMVPESQSTVRS